MKRIISCLLCFVLIFAISGVVTYAHENDIALCNNNVMLTDTQFFISNNGKADINVAYYGYIGITTQGTITTILEKKVNSNWVEMYKWTENSTADTYLKSYTPQLTQGTYRLTVEYRISGFGGVDDVIVDVITKTY